MWIHFYRTKEVVIFFDHPRIMISTGLGCVIHVAYTILFTLQQMRTGIGQIDLTNASAYGAVQAESLKLMLGKCRLSPDKQGNLNLVGIMTSDQLFAKVSFAVFHGQGVCCMQMLYLTRQLNSFQDTTTDTEKCLMSPVTIYGAGLFLSLL